MTDTATPPDNTTPPTDGGPADGNAPASVNADQTPDSDASGPDDAEDDEGDSSAARKARREAAGLRKRLREVEVERDRLRDQLDAHRQDVINEIATEAGLPDVGLLAAAGYELDGFITEDGRVDRAKITGACRDVISRYRITPKGRAPQPNPQQAAYGPPQRQPGVEWTASFGPRPR